MNRRLNLTPTFCYLISNREADIQDLTVRDQTLEPRLIASESLCSLGLMRMSWVFCLARSPSSPLSPFFGGGFPY